MIALFRVARNQRWASPSRFGFDARGVARHARREPLLGVKMFGTLVLAYSTRSERNYCGPTNLLLRSEVMIGEVDGTLVLRIAARALMTAIAFRGELS